jgi:hypothetical protein
VLWGVTAADRVKIKTGKFLTAEDLVEFNVFAPECSTETGPDYGIWDP